MINQLVHFRLAQHKSTMDQLNFDIMPQLDTSDLPQYTSETFPIAVPTPSSSKKADTPNDKAKEKAEQVARRREQNRLAQRRHREKKRKHLAMDDHKTDSVSPQIDHNETTTSSVISHPSIEFTITDSFTDSCPQTNTNNIDDESNDILALLSMNSKNNDSNSPLTLTSVSNKDSNSNSSLALTPLSSKGSQDKGVLDLFDMTFDWDASRKRQNTNAGSFQNFPDEHMLFMPTYNVERAFIDISRSITKVISAFKFDPTDDDLISPLNSITLSDLAENNNFLSEDTSPESDTSSSNSSRSAVSRWKEALNRLPKNLRPTKLQLSIPHHPSIDVIPWPSVRDKLLLMGHIFDNDSSCEELLNGLRVWGCRPELDGNWEITPRFAYQLWFLLDEDIMERTNWWRSQRNLLPIDIDAISKAQANARINQKNSRINIQDPLDL